jgi:hypothetical protein
LSAVVACVGESLAPLAGLGLDALVKAKAGAQDLEVPADILARVVSGVASKLGNSAQVLDVIRRINAGGIAFTGQGKAATAVDLAQGENAELHFASHFDELPGWIRFALETQFGPFLKSLVGLGAGRGAAATVAAPTSPSTSASAGQSSA